MEIAKPGRDSIESDGQHVVLDLTALLKNEFASSDPLILVDQLPSDLHQA